MKPFGLVLAILGGLALIFGGINYSRQKTILDVGPFKATATEHKSLPLSPIVGGLALAGGLVLLFGSRKSLSV